LEAANRPCQKGMSARNGQREEKNVAGDPGGKRKTIKGVGRASRGGLLAVVIR